MRERNLDIIRDILTIAGLEGVRGRTDIVTVPGLKGRLSAHIMKYKDTPHQWMSANSHLWKNDDGKICKILGVAISLSRARTADNHSLQDCYAWIFGDYTWKHTYTPAVAAFIAADKFAAEHKAEADKIAAGGGGGVTVPPPVEIIPTTTPRKEQIGISQSQVPPGTFQSRAIGTTHPPNNPIILNAKCARDMSHKSPTKSLTPNNLINPVSTPISHTSASSPIVSTSAPTTTLIAGGIRGPDRQGQNIIVGAVISDTGTETCIWGKEVKNRLYDIQPLSCPVRLQVASGAHIYVHERAKMRVGEVELEGYVMPDSPLSLISVDDLCVQGWTYVQNALSAWYIKDGFQMELIREGKLWVFPPESKATIHGPVAAYSRLTPIRKDYNPFSALTPDDDDDTEEDSSIPTGVPNINPLSKSTVVMNPLLPLHGDSDTTPVVCGLVSNAAWIMHSRQGHFPHSDKCAHCIAARLKQRARRRKGKKDGSKLMMGPGLGLSLSTDLMGPMPSELSAYTYSINLINASNLWCCFGGLENKTSAEATRVCKTLELEMRTWSNIHPDTRVVRIHSDMGGEFKSHFEKWCNDLGARKTGTGGYNSIQNPLGELFNRLGQEGMRALLSQATGCDPYYFKSLWLLALKQAAYWLNRSDSKTRKSPWEISWGTPYVHLTK